MAAAASLAAGGAATLWMLRRSDADPAEALGHLPLEAHLLALLAFGVEFLARGIRVLLVARALGLPLTLATSVKAQLAGDGLAAVTPSRVGADPAKMTVLRRDGLGVGSCGALLVAEMGAESLVLLAVALVILVGPWSAWLATGLAGYAGVVSSLGVVAFLASRASDTDPPALWLRLGLGASRWGALRRATHQFRVDTARLREVRAPWVVGVLAATLVHILARMAVLPLLVLPLVSDDGLYLSSDGLAQLVLRPLFVLYATALLPPPGGGGGVEVAFATALGRLLQGEALAATVIWWRVYTFYLGAALGGLLVLLPGLATPWRRREGDTAPSREMTGSIAGPRGDS